MKKKLLSLLLISMLSALIMACGKQEGSQGADSTAEPSGTEAVSNEGIGQDEKDGDNQQLSEEEQAVVFQEYIDGQKKLAGTSFKMYGNYSEENGIYDAVEADDGLLFWYYYSDDCLITVDYMSATNNLNINSWFVNDKGELDIINSINLQEFIPFSDDLKILFSALSTQDKDSVLMIESRGLAYSYADGVDYRITLIEIRPDGSLDKFYEDGLAGSGDEDITSEIRSSFNKAVGQEYSKDEFEDIFYNGNLFIEQENKPVYATITFKSESGKLADSGDWDGANVIVSQIYDLMENPGDPVYWGEGKIEADSFK